MSLADDLAELDQAEPDDQGSDQGENQPSNLYASVHEFVTDFIAQIYAHPVADRQTSWRWCSRWHHHAEAVARLEAAWKAFEALRQDPGTGASVWFRDHGDPAMTALTGSEGPFRLCSDTTHKAPPALPCQPFEKWTD